MFGPRRYCRYRIYLECVLLYSSFWIHSLSTHRHVGLLRCPLSLPGALFPSFVLFWLRRYGAGFPWQISIGIGAWTMFVKTRYNAWLHFADFCSSGDCVSNPVFHNSPWHRCLACTCRGSQLFSFLEVLGNNSCNPFLSMILRYDSMPSADAFVLHKIFQPVNVWWYMMTDIH